MASEAKPPILAAPLEIRLEIYRYAWTITFIDAERRFEKALEQYRNGRYNLYPDPWEIYDFKLRVGQLHALVSICRQIRDEVLSEYFHRTQVYNRHDFNPMLEEVVVPYEVQHIQSSLLFASYTQHVSLRWTPGGFDAMTSTLDWLLQLKQLKTLELVIMDSCPHSMESALDRYFDSSLFQRLTTLRNLEKIVVKLRFWEQLESDGDIWEREVERTPRLQKIKEILSESVREDLRQPEQQPAYVFEQHIGYRAVWPDWPLSYRI